jgi:hypothetical protein
MSQLLAELRARWTEALASGTSYREWRAIALSTTAPVKLLAGVRDRDGRISILIETGLRHAPKHRMRFQAEGISLYDERSAAEGLLRLALTLERADLRDVFEVLVVDLISVVSTSPSPEVTVQQTIRRLEAWQACLHARRRGLEREEVVGLLGELAVMELVGEQIGFAGAISAWSGPADGIHDFQSLGIAVELKATVGLSHHLRISRLDQLDSTGLRALVLLRARFHEAPDGLTLPEVIGGLRAKVDRCSPAAAGDLKDKLMRVGYLDADADIYGSMRVKLHEVQGFRVSDGFPRLYPARSRQARR